MSEGGPNLLRAFLTGRDAPCPFCAYNLRDLTGNVCPECGEKLILAVRPAAARLGLWVAAIIGASVGAGFCGMVLGWFAYEFLVDGFSMGIHHWWPLLVGFIVQGGLIAALLRYGGRARRCSSGVRWLIALAAWAGSIGVAVLFFVVAA